MMIVKRTLPVVAVVLLNLSVCQAQQLTVEAGACSQEEIVRTVAQLDSVRKTLLDLPTGDGMQTDVSPAAQNAIASMKKALGDFINAELHCVSGEPDAAGIQKRLSDLPSVDRCCRRILH